MAVYKVTLDEEGREFVEVHGDKSLVDDGVLTIYDASDRRVAGFNRHSWLHFIRKPN